MHKPKPSAHIRSARRLFLVDAGNTRTTTACSQAARMGGVTRTPTRAMTVVRAEALVESARRDGCLEAVVVAAVVPSALECWRRAARSRGLPLLAIGGQLDPGVSVAVRRRGGIGADRMANVAAAVACFGVPVLVVDVGTATTFDAVTEAEGFVGGVIAPGPAMLRDALAAGTAQLPSVNWPSCTLPATGRSTASAIGIGLRVGYAGLIRGILAHLRASPGLERAPVCLTGGGARRIARDLGEAFPILPRLTLEGLVRLYDLNAMRAADET